MRMQWAFKCASSRVAVKLFCKGAIQIDTKILKKNLLDTNIIEIRYQNERKHKFYIKPSSSQC